MTDDALRPLTDLFDRVLGLSAPIVAFELDAADMDRWRIDRDPDGPPASYRMIPIRPRLGGESCIRLIDRAGGFRWHSLSRSMVGIVGETN
jgi:hypothetical protein